MHSFYNMDCNIFDIKQFLYKMRLFVVYVVVIKIKCPVEVYFLEFSLNGIFMFRDYFSSLALIILYSFCKEDG